MNCHERNGNMEKTEVSFLMESAAKAGESERRKDTGNASIVAQRMVSESPADKSEQIK